MSEAMQRATRVAGEIYSRFLRDVLETHVLKERVGAQLGEKHKKALIFSSPLMFPKVC